MSVEVRKDYESTSRGFDQRWSRHRSVLSGRAIHLATAGVVMVQATVNIYLLRNSYFFAEDFKFLGAFQDEPLTPELLSTSIFGHLIPGFIVVQKYFGAAFGANWIAASVATILIQAGGAVAFTRLVIALRGWSWWVPWLTAAFALGVVSLNTSPWWAATSTMELTVICSVSTWGCAIRYSRTHRRRHLVSLLVMFTLAISFFEKSIAVCVYLGLFALIVGIGADTSGPRDRARQAIKLWPVWVILAGVSLLDLYIYFTGSFLEQSGSPAGTGQTVDYLARSLPEGVFPSLLGAVYPISNFPGPDWITPLVSTLVAATVIAWSAARSRLALRTWSWFFLAVLVSQLLVARGRLSIVGTDVVVHNLRYQVDAAYLFLIALSVALPAAVATLTPRTRGRVAIAAAVAPLLVAPLWVQSVQAISDNSPGKSSRIFFSQLRADDRADGVAFLDLPVPGWVVPPEMYPWNMAAQVFPVVAPGTLVTNDPEGSYTIRFDGSLAPVQLRDLTTPRHGTTCVLRKSGITPILTVPEVPVPPNAGPVLLSLRYVKPRDASVALFVDTPAGQQEIRGLGGSFLTTDETTGLATVIAPGDWHTVSMRIAGRQQVCIADVRLTTTAG